MAVLVEEFDSMTIENASVQFVDKSTGMYQNGKKFGYIGTISGETTLKEIVKRSAGVEVKRKIKAEKMDITVSGMISVPVLRDIFGINNDDFVNGVYSYGTDSKVQDFAFTADVIDEFEERKKLIGFPNCSSSTGFKFSIQNGAEEVAELEISFTSHADENKKFYYEAFEQELPTEDKDLILSTWHSNLKLALTTAKL